MKSKFLPKWSLLIVAIAGVLLFSMIFLTMAVDLSAPQNLIVNASVNIQRIVSPGITSSTLPVRLKIPKIRVDAAIESTGLTKEGAVGIPTGPTTVAWFNLGTHPGEVGSAIITGHFGPWKGGRPTVFNNLYKLRQGDKIYVTDNSGITTIFVVREARRYDPKADAAVVFGSKDGQAHLNLITCEGVWNKILKSYSKRLVVFTDKEI